MSETTGIVDADGDAIEVREDSGQLLLVMMADSPACALGFPLDVTNASRLIAELSSRLKRMGATR